MKFAYLLFAVYLIVQPVGQMLQRLGMKQVGAVNGFSVLFSMETVQKIFSTPSVILGVLLSGMGFVLWIAVISNFKMSYIYPLSSIGYILMAFMSMWFLGEHLTWHQWAGTGIIVAGCILLNT